MTLDEAVAFVCSDAHQIAVIAWRYSRGAAPGSRIDLCCAICGKRVSLNFTNALRVVGGAPVFCRDECWPQIVARVPPAKINLVPDPTVYK